MNGYLIYSFKEAETRDKRLISYTVISCPIEHQSLDFLIESAREYFKYNNPTNSIALVFPSLQDSIFLDFEAQHRVIYDRLKKLSYDGTINLISYGADGVYTDLGSPGKKATSYFLEHFQQEGLYHIFMEGNGMLESDETFHYILPSGMHSKLFMRIGNVLSAASEVNFVAFCLLKYFKDNHKYIYCDSASISSLAYAVSLIRLKFAQSDGGAFKLPIIQSFGGYEHLDDYKFNLSSLILISASSTGRLKEKIIKKAKVKDEDIITLYYFNEANQDKSILINFLAFPFRNRIYDKYSFDLFKNETECELCNRNSFPVKLIGEHFLPAKPLISRIKITKKDHCPSWLNGFMEEFYGRGVIRCNYGNDPDKIREFYLDLNVVHDEIQADFDHDAIKLKHLKNYNYETLFYKFLENDLPISVECIICLPDKASEKMGEQIKEYFRGRGKSKLPEIVRFDDFLDFHDRQKDTLKGTILVAASSIATGKKLYYLSILFRDFSNCSIYYLFGIARTPSDEILKTITSDLNYRVDILNKNNSYLLEKIYIPDRHNDLGRELENSPWVQENNRINDSLRPFFIDNEFPVDLLNKRQTIILEAAETEGIITGLFWPNFIEAKGELALRKTFAFFDFDYEKKGKPKPNQADVYFTISAILHNLRFKTKDVTKFLEQHEYKRSVIAPQMFNRYSDGIIQASMLRAALPSEINYSVDFSLSYDAKKVLQSIFEDPESENSEALYEFLFAMAIGKLKLIQRDMDGFISFIKERYKGYDTVLALLEYVKSIQE